MRRGLAAATAWAACLVGCGFSVSSNPDGGSDDDGGPMPVTVGFAQATSQKDQTVGDTGVTVTLSARATSDITVDFTLESDTATVGDDVTPASGTLTIPAGAEDAQLPFTIANDGDATDESFTIRLSNPIGARLGADTHRVDISATPLPHVTVTLTTPNAAENQSGSAVFTLNTAPVVPVSLEYTIGGTATATEDYTVTPATVTFTPGGSLVQMVPLGVVNDVFDEDQESIALSFGSEQGLVIDNQGALAYMIDDDDLPPTVSFTTGNVTQAEGNNQNTVTFTATLSVRSGKMITVPFTIGGSATQGVDFSVTPNTALSFPPGTTTAAINVQVVGETATEYEETVTLTLTPPMNATLGAQVARTLSLTNDDPWCLGATPFTVCYPQLPAMGSTVTLPASINTTSDMRCNATQPTNWTSPQTPACFITAVTINVPATTTVTGSRPLVLMASGNLSVTGALDASSHVGPNPAAPGLAAATCGTPLQAPGASAGGAGGSFVTAGGDGGTGPQATNAGRAANTVAAPSILRAGCTGQVGDMGAAAGGGGGAVYLLAGGTLTISGIVNASGAGGVGGAAGSGGSGGGSGGMIVLSAPTLTVTGARILANGGGGAGGANNNAGGTSGNDPDPANPSTPAPGGPATGDGRPGGSGYAGTTQAVDGGNVLVNGGGRGGGGGGGGGGYIKASAALTGASVSAGIIAAP